jgi:hypothetical protein
LFGDKVVRADTDVQVELWFQRLIVGVFLFLAKSIDAKGFPLQLAQLEPQI